MLCAVCSNVWAGSRAHYTVDRVWTTDDGLPQNSVIALRQTRDGYLWLGTQNGLARFDGIRFSVFDESNTPGLNSGSIVKLFEDSQSNLWIGTETAGAVVVDKEGKVTSVDIGHRTREGRLMAIAEDPTGTVWLYTADGQLGWYRDKKLAGSRTFEAKPSLCRALIVEGSVVWVGTDTRLTGLGPFPYAGSVGLPEAYPEESGADLGRLDFLLPSKQGGYWRLAKGLIQKCRGNTVQQEPWPYPWTNAPVSAACEDREGNLVVGTLGEGVFWFDAAGKHT